MKAQSSKRLASCAVLVLATHSMSLAFADGDRPFEMRFAGGFLQNIMQVQLDMTGTPTGLTESRNIVLAKGQGTFGRADLVGVSYSGPPVSVRPCSIGLIKVADIVENNLVLTFSDLSLLYGNGSGAVCIDPGNPMAPPIVEIDGTWNGGTGRFENAGGDWSIDFGVFDPVGMATQFVAETGVIKGHITRSHDDD
jgi:hypothetical protein